MKSKDAGETTVCVEGIAFEVGCRWRKAVLQGQGQLSLSCGVIWPQAMGY